MNHHRSKAKGEHIRRAQQGNILDIVKRNDPAAVIKYAAVHNKLLTMKKIDEFDFFERVIDAKEEQKYHAD